MHDVWYQSFVTHTCTHKCTNPLIRGVGTTHISGVLVCVVPTPIVRGVCVFVCGSSIAVNTLAVNHLIML